MEKTKHAISIINIELGDMPTTANNIIKFINSKNRYELDDLGVDDKKETILEVKKVLTKKDLIVCLTEKCQSLEVEVYRFFTRIEALTKKVLPSLFVINEKLMTREYYMKKILDIAKDSAKSSHIKGAMIGRDFFKAINNTSFI